ALIGKSCHRGDRIVALAQQFVDQRVFLIEESARGVVVLDGKLAAGEPVIGGRNIHQGYLDPRHRLMEVSDLDLRRLVGPANFAEGDEDEETEQQAEHYTSEAKFEHLARRLSLEATLFMLLRKERRRRPIGCKRRS